MNHKVLLARLAFASAALSAGAVVACGNASPEPSAEVSAAAVAADNAAGAACGTVALYDAGGVIDLGTCDVGLTCVDNRCVCVTQACVGGKWDPFTCSCQKACHTQAQCCIQGGGEWHNGACI